MTVEVANFIADLEPTYPRQGDLIKEGDNHIRLIKNVIKQTFSGFNGLVTMTSQSLNRLDRNFKFSDDSTDIGGSVFFSGTQKEFNFNKNGIGVNRNTVTGVPLARTGTEGLTDAVSRDYLENGGGGARAAWPIGSIYISATDSNPANTLGMGTWVAFAPGRLLMGVGVGNDGDDTLNVPNPLVTGGKYFHTLTTTEIPAHSHSHNIGGSAISSGAHFHGTTGEGMGNAGPWGIYNNSTPTYVGAAHNDWDNFLYNTSTEGAHEHTLRITGGVQSTGGGGKHNNIQPYITVYMWRRTA